MLKGLISECDNSAANTATFLESNAVSGSLGFFGVIVLFNSWLYSLGIGSSLKKAAVQTLNCVCQLNKIYVHQLIKSI